MIVIGVPDEPPVNSKWDVRVDGEDSGFFYCIGQKPDDNKYYMSKIFIDVIGKYINSLKLFEAIYLIFSQNFILRTSDPMRTDTNI